MIEQPGARKSLASVIIPCFNQLALRRSCIAALRQHTHRPWEQIVVDNGSSDGTPHYLLGVQDLAAIRVEVITDAANRGFPAVRNQGLRVARGEHTSSS
jgi:glycosyltransferase involved in cell wall biosynthesis